MCRTTPGPGPVPQAPGPGRLSPEIGPSLLPRATSLAVAVPSQECRPQGLDQLTENIRNLFALDGCRQQEALLHLVQYPQGAMTSTNTNTRLASAQVASTTGALQASTGAGCAPTSAAPSAEEVNRVGEDASSSGDQGPVTTLTIRNLPHWADRNGLVKLLDDIGFAGLYDYLYTPVIFASGQCKGYAFVNMTSPEAATALVSALHLNHEIFAGSPEPLHVLRAAVQGKEANLAKWDVAKMRRLATSEHGPIVFPEASGDSTTSSWTTSPEQVNSDEKTTVKIKNIPRRSTRHELLVVIQDIGFPLDTINYFYLPVDAGRDCKRTQTRGYAIINFVDGTTAASFRLAVNSNRCRIREKKIETTMAPVQGLQANLQRYGHGHATTLPPGLDQPDADGEVVSRSPSEPFDKSETSA